MGNTKDYGLRVFPQETMDKIAEEFYNYFKRKNGARLTREDAKMLIDYYTGPTPPPADVNGIDYSRTVVTGGGGTRPTQEDIDAMLSKYEPRDIADEWDGVFDEVLEIYDEHPWGKKLIYLTFRDCEPHADILEALGMENREKYYRCRKIILTQAGVLAYHVGLVDLQSSVKQGVSN